MELVQRIYKNRDNVSNLKFEYIDSNGSTSNLNLSSLTRVDIIIHGANAGADVTASTNDGVNMLWDEAGNFKAFLGDLTMDVGSFPVTVIFYDALHPDGQIVISRNGERKLTYEVIND